MSIATEIARISKNISDSLDAVENKGVTIPADATSDDLPTLISAIGSGSAISVVDTQDVNGGIIRTITGVSLQGDTVAAEHLERGYTAHTSQGTAITGTLDLADLEEDCVFFVDYDGTVLYSYTASQAADLIELPANPTHEGLVAQGWNWTRAQIKSQLQSVPNGDIIVGQMYTTSSGATEIDVVISEKRKTPRLILNVNGQVQINWGDNTNTSVMTGSDLSASCTATHTYASSGNYTITLTCVSGSYAMDSTTLEPVFGSPTATQQQHNNPYLQAIRNVRLGNGLVRLTATFYNCCYLETITIPSTVATMTGSIFKLCRSLISVSVPSGISSIPEEFCSTDSFLKFASIPSTVQQIGASAFVSAYQLTNFTFPYGITEINNECFQDTSLEKCIMPNTITTIDDSAFYYAPLTKSLVLSQSLTTIGDDAFSGNRIQQLTLPASITSLGGYCFAYCYFLKHLVIEPGLATISNYSFYQDMALQTVDLPSTVTTIGKYAFQYCHSLESIDLSKVSTIQNYAFASCTSLRSVNASRANGILPYAFDTCNSLTSVDLGSIVTLQSYSFATCTSLDNITIPATVTTINASSLQYCYGLAEIHCLSTTPPTMSNKSAFTGLPSDCIIYVPSASVDAYKAATNWSNYASQIQGE